MWVRFPPPAPFLINVASLHSIPPDLSFLFKFLPPKSEYHCSRRSLFTKIPELRRFAIQNKNCICHQYFDYYFVQESVERRKYQKRFFSRNLEKRTMIKTNNLKIKRITPVIAPKDLRQVFPVSDAAGKFVTLSRMHITNILRGLDSRLMVVVVPAPFTIRRPHWNMPKDFPVFPDNSPTGFSSSCGFISKNPVPPSDGKD